MTIKYKELTCFELFHNEKSIGIFTKISEWNGIIELKSISDNNKIIALSDSDLFFDILNKNTIKDLRVIKASPGLHEYLNKD